MSNPEGPTEQPPISKQMEALSTSANLAKQTDDLAYGQVVFEIRDGRIYRMNVTKSTVFNERDIRPKKRKIYSSQEQPT